MIAPEIFEWTLDWARTRQLSHWAAEETTSTNSIAKDEAHTSEPVRLYVAKHQTQGRGRGSHTWTNPNGASLLSSWSFSIDRVPQPIFAALAGLSLYESCRSVWPSVAFNIKAPNDLFIADKKTAGILIETVDQGRSKRTIIGLGLNVAGVPAELSTATCLAEHLPQPPDQSQWQEFLNTWLKNLETALREGLHSQLSASHCARLLKALNDHPLLKEPILKVDEQGQLHSTSRTIYWHEL